jgi:Phycobilisome degradation protein nblA
MEIKKYKILINIAKFKSYLNLGQTNYYLNGKIRGVFMDTNSFQLTLEQQFQMRLIEQSAESLTREQLLDMLIQTYRLLMIKDNVIKDLVKEAVF